MRIKLVRIHFNINFLKESNKIKILGSFSDFYEVKTRESCTSIWKKGRRKCEAESLTGHPCYSKFHERDNSIQHSNNFKSTHTCSCGHAKKVRDDPFTLKVFFFFIFSSSFFFLSLYLMIEITQNK